jgi:hypothetical protein
MSTIFSTLLNNILPDAGQFYSSREVSSQTLLMFHVIVDIFLKMEFSLHHLLTPRSNFLLCYLLQVLCRDLQDRVILLSSQIQDIYWIVEKYPARSGVLGADYMDQASPANLASAITIIISYKFWVSITWQPGQPALPGILAVATELAGLKFTM